MPSSRAGRTSCVRLPSGTLTVQTELCTRTAEIVTMIDFRGRILKTWRRPLDAADIPQASELAARAHREVEHEVRKSLHAIEGGRDNEPQTP